MLEWDLSILRNLCCFVFGVIIPFYCFKAVAKNLSGRNPSSLCFVRNDPRPKLVYKESDTSRRREFTFVEAVKSLEHQLSRDDLRKAYQIAGQKFTG